MQDVTLQAIIKLRDEMSSQLRIINDNLRDMDDNTRRNQRTMREYSRTLKDVGKIAVATGGAIVTVVGGALAYSAKEAMKFESAFTGVVKTLNTDGMSNSQITKTLDTLNKGIREMSNEMPQSASELAGIAEIAGQLGIKSENILKFTKTMAMLADTTNIVGEEGSLQLAKFMNVMGTDQDLIDKLGSSIVHLGNNFATTEADILNMASRLSDLGILADFSETQVLAWATAMSSSGIEAEMGGTAMKKLVTEIERAVLGGGDALEQFAIIAGVSASEFKQAFDNDASNGTLMFLKGLNKVKQEGGSVSKVLDDMEIKEVRLRETILKLSATHDEVARALGYSNKAWEENNALSKEAELRYGTTESQLKMMRNQINNAAIDIGNFLLPIIRDASEFLGGLAKSFSNLDPTVKETLITFGLITLGIGSFLLLGGGLLIFIGACISAYATLTSALALFGLTLSGLMLPITIFILAITAIIGAIILVKEAWDQNWLGMQEHFKGVVDGMMASWKSFTDWVSAPFNANVNVSNGDGGTNAKKPKKNAFGGKITRNNELRRLHEGERVLTKQEANGYDRQNTSSISINIAEMTVREEADINKIANELAKKLKQQRLAFAGTY